MAFRLAFWAALVSAQIPAFSATLSAPDQVAGPGQALISSLVFTSEGQTISGVQFDLAWDDALDAKIVAGDRLREVSKILYTAVTGPHTMRCLIAGGAATIPEGEILRIFLVVDQAAAAGPARLRILNPAATDPAGGEAGLKPATITIDVLQTDPVFVTVLAEAVLNAASLQPGPVSPGELVTLFGGLPGGYGEAFVNGIPAPILYRGLNQWNLAIPYAVDPGLAGNLEIRAGGRVSKLSLAVVPTRPAIFTQDASGIGPGAILNEDYTLNSATNPAARGSTVAVFGTGFGALDPQPADGLPVPSAAGTRARVTATIGGVSATVGYAGAAPGLLAGLTQVNIQIPFDLEPGGAAPVIVRADAEPTSVGVFIAIK